MPHSVLSVPAQRPARGSAAVPPGKVQGSQPIEMIADHREGMGRKLVGLHIGFDIEGGKAGQGFDVQAIFGN